MVHNFISPIRCLSSYHIWTYTTNLLPQATGLSDTRQAAMRRSAIYARVLAVSLVFTVYARAKSLPVRVHGRGLTATTNPAKQQAPNASAPAAAMAPLPQPWLFPATESTVSALSPADEFMQPSLPRRAARRAGPGGASSAGSAAVVRESSFFTQGVLSSNLLPSSKVSLFCP